jgi:hypothetical protein
MTTRGLRVRLVLLPCNGSRFLDVTDARAEHSVEWLAVGVEEQDALGEQRRSGGVEGDDVVIAGDLPDYVRLPERRVQVNVL